LVRQVRVKEGGGLPLPITEFGGASVNLDEFVWHLRLVQLSKELKLRVNVLVVLNSKKKNYHLKYEI
tara:strand:+ start:515 stop:715 length:201 start_codon:yes stop_codon:yes gene_type:complete